MISSNTVYIGNNTQLLLTDKIDELDARMLAVEENDSLRGLDEPCELVLANGTFSGSFECERLETNKIYMVSIKYTNSNGLVDQSLYTVRYQPGVRLQPTYNVVKCYNGNDNLLVTLTDGSWTLATQYTGTTAPTNAVVKFI